MRVTQQLQIRRRHGARPARLTRMHGPRFGQAPQGEHCHHAEHGKNAEDHPPRGKAQHLATDERRHNRRYAHHQQHDGKRARTVARPVDVAHDGLCNHRHGASAEGLHKAPHHHMVDAVCERAANGTEDVERDTGRHRPATPEAVGQRPPHELPESETEEEVRQGELCGCGTRAQLMAHRHEPRQIHVGGRRRDHHEQAENAEQHTLGWQRRREFGRRCHYRYDDSARSQLRRRRRRKSNDARHDNAGGRRTFILDGYRTLNRCLWRSPQV